MALSGVFPVILAQAQYEQTYASLTVPGFPGHLPGDVSIDNLGGNWVFAKASEALTAHALCRISTAATPLAIMAAAGDIDSVVPILGIPQVAVDSGYYAWFWRGPGGGVGKGIKVLSAADNVLNTLQFATAVDGVIDNAVVTDDAIAGLSICATITTATATECYATTIIACNLDEGVS